MKIALLTTDNREAFADYAAIKPYFGTAPEALLQGFACLPEIEVHVISGTRRRMQSPEKIAPNIFFHSVHVPRVGWTPTFFQGIVRAVRREIKRLRPDIVHGQGTERDCALSAVFSGYPNVLTIHGNMRLIAAVNRAPTFSFQGMAARLEQFTLPRADGVICITRYTENAVKDLAKKTWITPNAVDASFFEIQPVPDVERIILCVGVVCQRKNQNVFIRSLDSLAAERKFKVIFLGAASRTQPYGAEFLELIASRPRCEFAGFADREKLKTWFQRATMLALPSLEDNCPMVVLEAMAAGVPVMAANVGGVPDLVTDEKTGLLCDPLDPQSLRHGVARILDDAGFAQKLAAAAREEARARFHPLVIARAHLEIYREVLSRDP